MAGNYPAELTDSSPRAPWNAPEIPEATLDDQIEYAEEHLVDDVIYEGWDDEAEADAWLCELLDPDGNAVVSDGQPTVESAIALFIAERGDEIDEWIDERRREEPPEPDEPDWDAMPGGADDDERY